MKSSSALGVLFGSSVRAAAVLILTGLIAGAQTATPPATKAPGWKLVWSDEFNGDKLDYSKWGVEVNAFGGGNNELQLYSDRPENVRVENGHLILEARKDNPAMQGAQRQYSSGRVRTKHRGDWRFARVEVRAKLPAGRGLWPAIWMLPTDDKYGTWAASGEIDIMELVGHEPDTIRGSLAHGGPWPKHKFTWKPLKRAEDTFTDTFHTFALEWESGEIRWYVDGKHWQTQNRWRTEGAPFPAPFDQSFHLLLNLAVGGKWPGPPDGTTAFPSRMEVDWVRVHQRAR